MFISTLESSTCRSGRKPWDGVIEKQDPTAMGRGCLRFFLPEESVSCLNRCHSDFRQEIEYQNTPLILLEAHQGKVASNDVLHWHHSVRGLAGIRSVCLPLAKLSPHWTCTWVELQRQWPWLVGPDEEVRGQWAKVVAGEMPQYCTHDCQIHC